jgi:hypothetical protein
VGRFCRKAGARRYRYLRGDPDQQAQARPEQAAVKNYDRKPG